MKLNSIVPRRGQQKAAAARRSRRLGRPGQDLRPRRQGPARAQGRLSQGRLRRRPDADPAPPAEGRLPLEGRAARGGSAPERARPDRGWGDRSRLAQAREPRAGAGRARADHALWRNQGRSDDPRAWASPRARAKRSRPRAARSRRPEPASEDRGQRVAKSPGSNPVAAFGEASRFTELRRRFFFLLGGLIVYRIGTFIPVPGIDPVALARLFQDQQGTILSMFNMFSGGALQRLSILALGVMPYISASIIVQMMAVVVPHAAGAAQGRRGGQAQAHAVHAHGHGRARDLPGGGRGGRVPEPGRGDQPGRPVRLPRDAHADRGHHVPDVARRADHRARSRQRHLDDHSRGHRRRAAGGDRRHARAGAQRRDQPGAGAAPDHDGGRRSRSSSCSSSARSARSRSTTPSASRAGG